MRAQRMVMNEVVVRCIMKHEISNTFSSTEHRVQYKEYPVQLNTSEYNVTSINCPVCRREVTFMVLPQLPFCNAISVGLKVLVKRYFPFAVPLFLLEALKPLRFKIALVETQAYKHVVFYHRRDVGLYGGYDSDFTEARIEYYQQGQHKKEEPATKAESMLKSKLETLKAKRDFEGLTNARALDQLLDLLQNDDRHIQARAATALGELGDTTAVPHLIRAAMRNHFLKEHVFAAIERVQWKPCDDSLSGIFMLLKHTREELVDTGQLAVVPLIVVLSDKEIPWKWRIEAGDVLSKIGDARAILPLVEALREANATGDRSARKAALLYLIRLGEAAVGPVNDLLAAAIHQQNEELESACLTILGNIAKNTKEATE